MGIYAWGYHEGYIAHFNKPQADSERLHRFNVLGASRVHKGGPKATGWALLETDGVFILTPGSEKQVVLKIRASILGG